MNTTLRIALVHDWLVSMRGGEKVLEVLCELFPRAVLFSLVHAKGACSPIIERMEIRTSFLQSMPRGVTNYQHYLPLFPAAVGQLDMRGFDLIISSSSAVAKGVRVPAGAHHVCYCHTPMRYIWDQFDEYFGRGRGSLASCAAMSVLRPMLQRWDVRTSRGVDEFIANSENVRERIRRLYARDSVVIYPPVDTGKFALPAADEGYYLVVSALVPYKRIDLAVEACTRLKAPLVIVGRGMEERKLRARAGKNVAFVGWCDEDELARRYAGCRALLFPGEEDFGIVPLEAMAAGKPVIAFAKGGALETVSEGTTGVYFHEATPEALMEAIGKCERMKFVETDIRAHAAAFDRKVFRSSIESFLRQRIEARARVQSG